MGNLSLTACFQLSSDTGLKAHDHAQQQQHSGGGAAVAAAKGGLGSGEEEGDTKNPTDSLKFFVSPLALTFETEHMSEDMSSYHTAITEGEHSAGDGSAGISRDTGTEDGSGVSDLTFMQSPSLRRVPHSVKSEPETPAANVLSVHEEEDDSSVSASVNSILPLCSPLSEMTQSTMNEDFARESSLLSPKLPPSHVSRRFRKAISATIASNFPSLYRRKRDRGVIITEIKEVKVNE